MTSDPLPFLDDRRASARARGLAREMVRAYAAISRLLDDLPPVPAATPDRVADALSELVAERLLLFAQVFDDEDLGMTVTLLAEATDNLGFGELLRPDEVPAFHDAADRPCG